ncbi:CYTH domain-containing protein [Cyanobacterium sp. Dongsha4]|uniref:CYTH domain-containing protein n=1 Tax=Cyanobacterium sp. DS4 TaxID=2878255 RepID=UPI002E80A807|nr:CYTH domain-containing protein [Cyanobacterium sp. Dongsha4]WVK99986.1 CYTH domain-containing protein [Cyanobacterium sp. Dongsha4]
MGLEIERKFLVNLNKWFPPDSGLVYRQGYIYTVNGNTVRVRIVGKQGYLTLKGKTKGQTRSEFEYSIPAEEAEEILQILCDRPFIEKIRYKIPIENLIWEVDEFLGDNKGLTMAEVELTQENQNIIFPEWIGEEVTHDLRYYNSYLAKNPFSQW